MTNTPELAAGIVASTAVVATKPAAPIDSEGSGIVLSANM